MDSEKFQELLPWLANNTLAPADRDAMIAFLAAHPEARGDVREIALAMVSVGGHPANDWLAETARDASFEHRTAVLNHLATCVDCAEVVALARVAHATPEMQRVATSAEPASSPAVPFTPRPSSRPLRNLPMVARALAVAAILLACIGLGRFWERLDAPPARVIIAEVPAPDAGTIAALRAVPISVAPSTLRGEGEDADLLLGPDRDAFMVEMQLPTTAADVAVLGSRLETQAGELVTALVPGPRSGRDGILVNVMIPAADLVADQHYVLVVEDVETGHVLDRYPLRAGTMPESDSPAAVSP